MRTSWSSGALTQGSLIYADPLAEALQVDASGTWLLDASDSGYLYAIPITSSGAVDSSRTTPQPVPLASTVKQGSMAISPTNSGAIIAVALGTAGTQVFPFNYNSATPISAAYTPTIAPYGPQGTATAVSVAIDPQNSYLYIGETNAFPNSTTNSRGGLRFFKIISNGVNPVVTIPYAPTGTGPNAILPSASGSYVYTADWNGTSAGNITGYSVSSSGLTLVSSVATGADPLSLAEDSTGSFVLEVGSNGSPYFNAFTFDGTTAGQLDADLTSTTQGNFIAVVAAAKQ